MQPDSTPLLPNFPHRFGRPAKSSRQRLAEKFAAMRAKQLGELRELMAPWVDASLLDPTAAGPNCRRRVFSLEIVFWAFFYQVLSGVGCAAAVARVQQWRLQRQQAPCSSNTGAYCQARNRLPGRVLSQVFAGTVQRLTRSVPRWHGRAVKVVDGTCLQLADTPQNQEVWPQNHSSTAGCGFPQLRLVGLFELFSGTLLAWDEGNQHASEHHLWRRLWHRLCPGDVVLGDSLYGCYAFLAGLSARRVDGLYRLSGPRKISWRRGQRLGRNECLQTWKKPKDRGQRWTVEEWQALPLTMAVRIIRFTVPQKGFRPETITIVTTLLDPRKYPTADLIDLFRHRWDVELRLRDIKTTMGMSKLLSRTPAQVRKELTMYAICYNVLRGLMSKAAARSGLAISRISFKGTAEHLHQWLPLFMRIDLPRGRRRALLGHFLTAITSAPVPDRPNRYEPRVIKGRAQPYKYMTRPRRSDAPQTAPSDASSSNTVSGLS